MKKLILLPMLLASAGLCFAEQTANYELRAVPVPGAVKFDGKLDDWDRSGGILMCYDTDTLLDTHSVRAYAMHDAEYLYLAFEFKDPTPMLNHVDPQIEPGSGWRSDCVQLRVETDRVIHVDAYYFTDKQQPVMAVMYNEYGVAGKDEGSVEKPLDHGAGLAFQKQADGKGYTQEMRIPWKLLRRDGASYKAGDTFRMGIECMYGDGTAFKFYGHRLTDLINPQHPKREFFWQERTAWGKVVLLATGNLPKEQQAASLTLTERIHRLKYSTQGPVAFDYQIPGDGRVTLVVESPDGKRVRNLIADYPRNKGKNTDHWDGLDDDGKPCTPGSYRVRGLWHPEFDVLYQFAYGSSGDPPWETPNGTGAWLSDMPPSSAASDGETVFVSGVYYEGGVGIAAFNLDGKKLWGVRAPNMVRDPAAAVDDQYLYLACGREAYFGYQRGQKSLPDDMLLLQRLDKKTGAPVPFDGQQRPFVELGTVPGLKGLPFDSYGEIVEKNAFSADVTMARVKGLTVGNGAIYVPSYFEDEVIVCDAKTGKVLDRIKTLRPSGIVVKKNGELLVVNARDKQILAIDPKTKQSSVLIADHLDAPVNITLDQAGNLYVGDWGRAMCVKVFSPDGKFLRTIGKDGGRPWTGKFDKNGMLLPWGIAIDKQDRLWAVEWDMSPRRISVWKTGGRFVRDFVEAHIYNGMFCWIYPDRPERAIGEGAELELDWKKGTYRTLGTPWRPTKRDALFGPWQRFFHQKEVKHKGRTFLVTNLPFGPILISERKGDRYQPLTLVGNVGIIDWNILRMEGGSGFRFLQMSHLFRDHLYWKPQLNEYVQKNFPEAFDGSFVHAYDVLAPNLNDIFHATSPHPELKTGPQRLPTTNFTWSDRDGDGVVQEAELAFFEVPGHELVRFYPSWTAAVDNELTVYQAVTDGPLQVWQMKVTGWTECGSPIYDGPRAPIVIAESGTGGSQGIWADRKGRLLSNGVPEMKMYDRDGRVLWTYPNKYAGVHGSQSAPQSQPGALVGPLFVIGSAEVKGIGEVVCFNGNLGQAFLMTTDGLMVGSLMRDARSAPDDLPSKAVRGQSHKNTTMGAEWFAGQFFRNPRDGKPYLAGAGSSSGTRIYEVTGLDKMKPIPSMTVTLTAAGTTVAQQTSPTSNENRATVLQRLATPPTIDGKGDEYKEVVQFSADDRHRAAASAAWDAEKLYLFYQVKDNSPLKNQGKQGQFEYYKSGDAVLFEIGTLRATNDASPKAIAGDLRLLLTKTPDGPKAVLYRYVAPGTSNWVEMTTTLGTLRIDDGRVLSDVTIATAPTADGYTLEAAVPLSVLQFQPAAGKQYRGDFGVVYSDDGGLRNTFRLHWATRNTGMITDAYLEGQVQPAQWGVFETKE